MKYALIAIGVLGALVAACCLGFAVLTLVGGSSIDSAAAERSAAPAATSSGYLQPGERGRVRIEGSGGPFIANTPEDYSAFVKAATARDSTGLANLVGQDRIVQIPNGTAVQVIDYDGVLDMKYRGRVLEGQQAGRAGWIPASLVVR